MEFWIGLGSSIHQFILIVKWLKYEMVHVVFC